MFLQLLVALTGLHVQVLEDVIFAFGADLCRRHLQRVVVQQDGLQVPEVPEAQGHVGNSVTGHIQPNKWEFRNLWTGFREGELQVIMIHHGRS